MTTARGGDIESPGLEDMVFRPDRACFRRLKTPRRPGIVRGLPIGSCQPVRAPTLLGSGRGSPNSPAVSSQSAMACSIFS